MKVLVTAATRHGSTDEIADCIREELEGAGIRADLLDPQVVDDVSDYDAVILGSAVYDGRWLKPARELADRLAGTHTSKPIWLFPSGPLGDPEVPGTPAPEGPELARRLHAREHRMFPGKLNRDQLGLGERITVLAMAAPEGDFRDWIVVGRWARSIAAALHR